MPSFFRFVVEKKTHLNARSPDNPSFTLELNRKENHPAQIKVTWHPDPTNAGSHFFVEYRVKGDRQWLKTDDIENEDYTIISGLQDEIYEFKVVSVDSGYSAESLVKEISTLPNGNKNKNILKEFSLAEDILKLTKLVSLFSLVLP